MALHEATCQIYNQAGIGKLHWLHIPNTGSSFGNALIRWACGSSLPNVITEKRILTRKIPRWDRCKEKFILNKRRDGWPIGEHYSLNMSISIQQLQQVVTMLRGPGRHGKPTHVKDSKTIQKFAQYGLQTQYILGYKPPGVKGQFRTRMREPMTYKHAFRACFRIHHFWFVGITDLWRASLCLFHQILGGTHIAEDDENMRPVKQRPNFSERVMYVSDADDYVFNCAIDNFFASLLKTECTRFLQFTDLGSPSANRKLHSILRNKL